MDLIKQRKFYVQTIVLLVVLNVGSLIALWLQFDRQGPPPPREGKDPSALSVELMRQELRLSEEQTAKFQKLREEQSGSMREINDEIDALKLHLADLMFDPTADQRLVDSLTARLGELQSRLDGLRFAHFRAFAEVCDSAQKEILRPILKAVYSRKGRDRQDEFTTRRNEPTPRKSQQPGRSETQVAPLSPPRDDRDGARRQDEARVRREAERPPQEDQVDRPKPPTMAERVAQYVERLSLTGDQATQLERIMKATREEEEAFKSRENPTREQFEAEKERFRKAEDEKILEILTEEQKIEFRRMISNRGKNPPR